MSDFLTFQSDLNVKKTGTAREIDPLLYSNSSDPDVYFLVDTPIHRPIVDNLCKFILFTQPKLRFQIISVFDFQPRQKDLSRSVTDFYGHQSIDLTQYIKPWSKVVTFGRSLYSILRSDDLSIEGFYDTIQWNTSFFDPRTKSYIYPCPAIFSFLEKDNFERFFVQKQIKLSTEKEVAKFRIPKPNLIPLLEENTINDFLKARTSYNGITAYDLETKGLDPWDPEGKILCLTLAFDDEKDTAYYIPFDKINYTLLDKFFKNKKLVGNNLKYDTKWLRVKAGLSRDSTQIFWDNMKSSQALNELQYNSLKSDAWLFSVYGGYDFPLEEYKLKYPACKKDYSRIPFSVMFPYATMDALVSLECYREHQKRIDSLDHTCKIDTGWSIRRALEDVAFPAINTFCDIEISGMSYSWEKLKLFSSELIDEVNRRKEEIYKKLNIPKDISIDSGDQLGAFLESKGWENPGRSEKGLFLTNEAAMLYWKKKGHKEVDLFQSYTECVTVLKTFVGIEEDKKGKATGFFKYRASDDKIHGTFRVMMADSWRGKSSNPNLQNIIKNSTVELGGALLHVRVRELFCPPSSNFVVSENDAAGLQLRIAATYSQDPVMLDIFLNKGGDMHSITGCAVFCPDVSIDDFLKGKKDYPFSSYRKKAKVVNFGLLFGASARTFASTSLVPQWTLDEAKTYVKTYGLQERQTKLYNNLLKSMNKNIIDKATFKRDQEEFSYYWAAAEDIREKFFDTYKGLKEWHNKQHSFGQKNGYVQSSWGPIRRTPFLTYIGSDDDGMRLKNYENICLNSPVQNFEACYMMFNMSRTNKALYSQNFQSHLVGNIHDSFIAYLHREEMLQFKELSLSYFHEPLAIMKGIPYEIEMGYSDYEKKEYWGVTEHEF